MKKTSDHLVIIPARNEQDTIEEDVIRAHRYADVCVVNDASTDSTGDILGRFVDVCVVSHIANTHIAGALLDGMQIAVENGYRYAITMDAGLSHDPAEIPSFIGAEEADLVIGARAKKTHTPLHRRAFSKVGNLIYNTCLDFPRSLHKERYFSDLSSGFRRYSNRAMRLLLSRNMISHSFDFQFESAMIVYSGGLRISEIPITYDFTGSSFNRRVVQDCLRTCARAVLSHVAPPAPQPPPWAQACHA